MQRPSRFLQQHPNSLPVIYSSSPSTDHRRCSKEDEPIVALDSPGMSVPKIIHLDEGQLGCLPYCLLLCSSQVPIYFLLSICSSIFACSSTSHALHILVPITLVGVGEASLSLERTWESVKERATTSGLYVCYKR